LIPILGVVAFLGMRNQRMKLLASTRLSSYVPNYYEA
jgi:hypothetical protein